MILGVVHVVFHNQCIVFYLQNDAQNYSNSKPNYYSIEADEYFFKGHFPDNPIMPGVLIIESMAQTGCFLSFNNENFNKNNKIMLLSMIKSSKFIKKVIPGDVLFIEVELMKYKLGTASIKGVVKVNNNIVAKAEFMATVTRK